MKLNKSAGFIFQILMLIFIIIAINVMADIFDKTIDLTEDQRFTITDSTDELVASIDNPVLIRVLLDGDLPAGFKRLQASTEDLLAELREINPNLVFEFEDPADGTAEEVKKRQKQLVDDQILPTSLKFFDGKEYVQKLIFPYALITYGTRKMLVNLLEEQQPGQDQDIVLNNSVSLLEYKFSNAFQKLGSPDIKKVLFTSGNGEINPESSYNLQRELSKYYRIGHVALDTITHIDSSISIVIVAGPRLRFNDKDLFKLDQYLMNGGKILWLVDKLNPELDSISKYKFYVPTDIETGLDELFFKYGFRLEPNLVMDMESSSIPQIIGMQGEQPQIELFKWLYHPLVTSRVDHPIVKNIDRVNLFFPASIDTIKTEIPVKKTPLLISSNYSRVQYNPMRLSFEILKLPPDPSKFNNPNQVMAMLLEGEFESAYKNRVSPEFKKALTGLGLEYKEKSIPTRQLVVADSDFIKNTISDKRDIGYNKWDKNYYKGNKDFILNAIEYLLDDSDILKSRSKEIKLRLLDAVKTQKEKTKWQLINIGLPLLFLLIFGLLYNYFRKKKYSTT
jgi:gliding-associated putative ABC transporter substrate-binding component GldG